MERTCEDNGHLYTPTSDGCIFCGHQPVFRVYLAVDSWLCDVGGIADDGKIRRAPR